MSRLIIEEPPLQVLPSLAVAVGLNEAIVLQQIHYWLRQSKNVIDGHAWVYNSVRQWKQQFPFWSDDTIARALKSLRARGVLVAEALSDDPRDRSLYYRIDYQALDALEIGSSGAKCITANCGNGHQQHAAMDTSNLRQSYIKTETTAETTNRETRKRAAPAAPLLCPPDVDAQVWDDWLALRKAKKAPVTATVLKGAQVEAGKASMSLEAFLEVWCRRGSQGLEAAWLKPEERAAGAKPGKPPASRFDSIDYREGINDDGSF